MMTPITLSELAAAIIAPLEGVRLKAYLDSGGIPTIGIGHTGPEVKLGLVWTMQQVQEQFIKDQAALLKMVEERPLLEAAALVSFGFNCGTGALRKVLDGHALPGNFTHDHMGHELPGLVTRRHLEETLIALSQQMEHAK